MPSWPIIKRKFQRIQFTRTRQLSFLEDLSTLIRDGVVATQAIEAIQHTGQDIIQQVASDINFALASGRGLAEGMRFWFPHTVCEIVYAGEESGILDKSLSIAANTLRESAQAIKEIINSMLYPVTVFLMSLSLLVFIKSSVLKSFLQLKPLEQWPPLGQNLFYFGYLLETWWWFYLAFIVLLVISIIIILRYVTGDIRYLIDRIPILSFYRSSVAAHLMQNLGLLISNGIVFKRALSLMHHDAPPYLSWHLLMMEYNLSEGKDSIAEVLNTQLINENDLFRLKLMSYGKGVEYALVSLGKQSYQNNLARITRVGRILGALFLVGTTLIVMFIVAGIYNISSILAIA